MVEHEKYIKDVGDQQGDLPFQQPLNTVLNKGYSTIDVQARRQKMVVPRVLPRSDMNCYAPSVMMGPKQKDNQKEDRNNGRG